MTLLFTTFRLFVCNCGRLSADQPAINYGLPPPELSKPTDMSRLSAFVESGLRTVPLELAAGMQIRLADVCRTGEKLAICMPRQTAKGWRSKLVVYDLKQRKIQIELSENDYLHPTFSPNGKMIAAMLVQGRGKDTRSSIVVVRVEKEGSKYEQIAVSSGRNDIGPQWSSSGDMVAFLRNHDDDIRLCALVSTQKRWIEKEIIYGEDIRAFCFGKELFNGKDGFYYTTFKLAPVTWAVREWKAYTTFTDGKVAPISWMSHGGDIYSHAYVKDTKVIRTGPVVSPDGRMLAFFDDAARRFNIIFLESNVRVSRPCDEASSIAWSRDSIRLFYGLTEEIRSIIVCSGWVCLEERGFTKDIENVDLTVIGESYDGKLLFLQRGEHDYSIWSISLDLLGSAKRIVP